MPRLKIDQYAATFGNSSSTYIADPEDAQDTLTTALSQNEAVFIRGGIYNFSDTFDAVSGDNIIGDPNDLPVLKIAAGTNKTVITNANASTGGITTGVTMKNLIVDQQGALQTAGGGIVVTGIQDWTLDNIRIKQSYRFNFLSLHQSTGVANRTGTITCTKGSATVSGSGTLFTTQLAVDDVIKTAGGQFGRVESIENATSLTLTLPWGSATETGVTYKKIEPNSGCVFTRMRYEGTVDNSDVSGYGFFDDGIVEDSYSTGAGGTGGGFVPDHARNMEINNCVSDDHGGTGFSLETCEDCTLNDTSADGNVAGNGYQFISGTSRCTVNRGVASNNPNHGFVVTYNTTAAGIPRDNVFVDCVGYLNGGYAFRDDGALNTEFDTVTGYNNNTGGLITNTSNSSVPTGFNIHDSHFYDDRGGSKSQDRGVFIVTGLDGFITNTTALDSLHVIAGIVDSGTNTTKSGNITT